MHDKVIANTFKFCETCTFLSIDNLSIYIFRGQNSRIRSLEIPRCLKDEISAIHFLKFEIFIYLFISFLYKNVVIFSPKICFFQQFKCICFVLLHIKKEAAKKNFNDNNVWIIFIHVGVWTWLFNLHVRYMINIFKHAI